MNIEINNIPLIRNGLHFRYYGSRALRIVSELHHKLTATVSHYREQEAKRATLEKERFSAMSVAQVQTYRFNR